MKRIGITIEISSDEVGDEENEESKCARPPTIVGKGSYADQIGFRVEKVYGTVGVSSYDLACSVILADLQLWTHVGDFYCVPGLQFVRRREE
jgi:hypothetical protein